MEPKVTIPGSMDIIYECHLFNINGQFRWSLNGRQPEFQTDRITTGPTNGPLVFLNFNNISEDYIIQCIVTRSSGEDVFSNKARLLVQGKPVILDHVAKPNQQNNVYFVI